MRKFFDPFALLFAKQQPGGAGRIAASTNPRIAAARGKLDQIQASQAAAQPTAAQRAASEAVSVQKKANFQERFDKQTAFSEERRNRRSLLGGSFGSLGGRSLLGG